MRKSERATLNREGSATQFRSGRNNRAQNRSGATSQPVVLQRRRGPGKQPASEQAKGLGTMQTPIANAPLGYVAGMDRQNLEALSAETVTKSRVPQIVRASPEPKAMFFDESLAPMTSVGMKEIQSLARFLPVIVLIPRSAAAHQVTRQNDSLQKSTSEQSNATDLLGLVGKGASDQHQGRSRCLVVIGDSSITLWPSRTQEKELSL